MWANTGKARRSAQESSSIAISKSAKETLRKRFFGLQAPASSVQWTLKLAASITDLNYAIRINWDSRNQSSELSGKRSRLRKSVGQPQIHTSPASAGRIFGRKTDR